MRLQVVKTKNAASLYVVKTTTIDGRKTSKVVEKLGTEKALREKLGGADPYAWAKEYVEKLTLKDKQQRREILVSYSPTKPIPKNEERTFVGGYLFLQKIYHELGLDKIVAAITDKHKFEYDMNAILSRLLYGRILFPASKLGTLEFSEKLLERPKFDLHQIYRALEVLSSESEFIQSELYKNSLSVMKRNTSVLYYDCTNYFFESQFEEGLKQYGVSKEHRPNPIVQMGLFMDSDGIPLAFSINPGNTNEQTTLKPLEKQIIRDFGKSKFVVCTDAGLSSYDNRKFNNIGARAFVTTQSVKTLKKHNKEWALSPKGWKLPKKKETYNISEVSEEEFGDAVFYKEDWINENGLEQRLIVTFSFKYKAYQSSVREKQINRAVSAIESNPTKLDKARQNDYKRFVVKTSTTAAGEVAETKSYSINEDLIAGEAMYDGFYAVCTNLEDKVSEIIAINKRRWEIEESFRIMKSEFKARPVYLKRDDRIEAHFLTCFIALTIYRILEKKLEEKFTTREIIEGLRGMNFLEVKGDGYLPAYTRTDFTDALHEASGFRTDFQLLTYKMIKNIFNISKT